MKKSTEELLNILKHSTLDDYLNENKNELVEEPLCVYLNEALNEKGLTKAAVIEKSNLGKTYAYQIFDGRKRAPSRDKLIALCFGMDLNVDETQTILKYAGYMPLYPRNKRDSVIIAALEKGESVIHCNIILDELNLSPL